LLKLCGDPLELGFLGLTLEAIDEGLDLLLEFFLDIFLLFLLFLLLIRFLVILNCSLGKLVQFSQRLSGLVSILFVLLRAVSGIELVQAKQPPTHLFLNVRVLVIRVEVLQEGNDVLILKSLLDLLERGQVAEAHHHPVDIVVVVGRLRHLEQIFQASVGHGRAGLHCGWVGSAGWMTLKQRWMMVRGDDREGKQLTDVGHIGKKDEAARADGFVVPEKQLRHDLKHTTLEKRFLEILCIIVIMRLIGMVAIVRRMTAGLALRMAAPLFDALARMEIELPVSSSSP